MIIAAGYMFVTGGSSPDTVKKAKTLLIYALVGVAVAVLAQGLVNIVQRLLEP